MSELAAMVLAGGAARRMGGARKPALAVGGVALLARVLAAVGCAAPRIVVGPGELVQLLPRGVSLTTENPPGGGPVAAAAAGLALLVGTDASRVALVAGDLPFLTVDTVEALRAASTADEVDGAVLVDDRGRDQWLCGVWRPGALRDRITALGSPDGRPMRELVDGLRIRRVEHPSQPPAWFDCDTEDDLRRAEEWAHGDPG